MRFKCLVPLLLLAQLWLAGCGDSSSPVRAELGVMTFNVLCSFCNADYAPWDERLAAFEDILARHDPDLIGLQELTWPEEVDDFLALRDGFQAIYFVGDEAGPFGLTDYPDATILYRIERFSLLEHGFYWLSATPDQAWATGWADGVQFARIVTWARFEDRRSGQPLLFVTTHFDNNSPNQEHSAPLLLERTTPWTGQGPVIVTGDFNSQPSDVAYQTLTEGASAGGFHLVNSFDYTDDWSISSDAEPPPDYDVDGRIDHIFTAGDGWQWRCPQWTVDMFRYGQVPQYPSDHFAIFARLEYQEMD